MAAGYVDSDSGSDAATTTISVTRPSSANDGNHLRAFLSIRANNTIDTVPSGWSLVSEIDAGGASDPYLLQYKFSGSGANGSLASGDTGPWDFERSDDTGGHAWATIAISDTDGNETAGTTTDTGSGTSHAATGLTAATDDLLIGVWGMNHTTNATWSADGSMTEREDTQHNGGTLRLGIMLATESPSAGATGTRTSTSSTSVSGAAILVSVPAAVLDASPQVGIAASTETALPVTALPAPETATPLLELATRAPNVVAGALPTEAAYVEAETLTGSALFEHTTSGSDDLDFTGSNRLEVDLTLPNDGTAFTPIEATDMDSGRTTLKVAVAGSPTRAVTYTVDDGTTTETNTFYSTAIGRAAGEGNRIALAVEFDADGGVLLEEATRSDSSGSLAQAAWVTVGSASSNLTAIDTPATTRRWRVDSGTSRCRVIEVRIIDDGTQVARINAADIDTLGSTYTADSVTWNVDASAELRERGDWDDITTYARVPAGGIRGGWGRTGDQAAFTAGELTVTLDNLDRRFEPEHTDSPYYPMIRPLTPVRFCATYAGTVYPLFQGVARRFLPAYDPSGKDSTSDLEAVDAFRVFSLFGTGGTLGDLIDGYSPIAHWPMTDTGSTLDDTAGTNHLTPTSVSKAFQSPFYGNRRKVASFDGSNSVATDTSADSAVELTGDFSLVFIVNTTSGGDYHICSAYGSSGAYWGAELDCATDQTPVLRLIRNDGSPTSAGNDISLTELDYGYFTDGNPHVVVVSLDQSENTAVVYTAGRQVGTSTDAIPAANGDPSAAGTATIRVGSEGTHGSGAADYKGLLGYLAVFDKVLTADQAFTLTRATIDGFAESTPAQRVNALLDAYPWPQLARAVDSSTTSTESTSPEVSIDDTSSGYQTGVGNSDFIPVAAPANAIAGSTLWAAITIPGHLTMSTVPDGWSVVKTSDSGSTTSDVLMTLYRLDGYDGTTESWLFERSQSAGTACYVCVATTGVDSSTPATATATNDGTSTSVTATGVTADTGDTLITFHGTISTTTTLTNYSSAPSEMAELAQVNPTNKGSTLRTSLAAFAETNVSGSTGDKTATRSASEAFATITLAVNASGTGGSTAGALAAKDMSDASLLAELQAVESSELGEFFIDGRGCPTFRGRTWRDVNATTSLATFGDESSELNYEYVTFRQDEDRIVNEATVVDADGNSSTAVDADSRDTYGRRHESITLDLTGTGAASAHATETVARYKDPRVLVDTLAVFPASDAANLFPVVLGAAIGDRYTVHRRPPGWTSGDYIDREFHLERLEFAVINGTKDWQFRMSGSPAT